MTKKEIKYKEAVKWKQIIRILRKAITSVCEKCNVRDTKSLKKGETIYVYVLPVCAILGGNSIFMGAYFLTIHYCCTPL